MVIPIGKEDSSRRHRPDPHEGDLSMTTRTAALLPRGGHPGRDHGRGRTKWRANLVEKSAEQDDELLEKFLADGDLTRRRS
jgi:hypothetical protein